MTDTQFLRFALRLVRRGCGMTSPNPMVGPRYQFFSRSQLLYYLINDLGS
jgi:hypothetical protein